MKFFTQQNQQIMRINNFQNFYKRIRVIPLVLLSITLIFSSCVSQRNVEYLKEATREHADVTTFRDPNISDYKLKPNDELFIQIRSLDDPSTNIFQQLGIQQNGGTSGYIQPYGASLMSYMVDKSGYIQLPVLGNVNVKNKTIPEVSSVLQDSLNHILSKPTVTVKLVNRFVSVLGEVRSPGHFSYSQEKLTIFDALGLAGDITEYGDRNDVILARNENGKNLRINIDLTSAKLLTSEYYYLRPNDMVYVKPMRKKFWGMRQFPFQILLSSISTAVLLYTVFR